MGENLSEINRGPLLKKQRWRGKKDCNWNPTQRSCLFFVLSMAELLYSLAFWCHVLPMNQGGDLHYTGTFSLQTVLSKVSDLTRHIVKMTDAHLQASDKHLIWELSQRDQNKMCSWMRISLESKQIFKSLKNNSWETMTNKCIVSCQNQEVLLQGTTSNQARRRSKLCNGI